MKLASLYTPPKLCLLFTKININPLYFIHFSLSFLSFSHNFYMKMDDDASSILNCELTIIRAQNIELNNKSPSAGDLFVRCYISAGNNQRVQLNTREIPTTSATSTSDQFLWNDNFSLECLGSERSINSLRKGNVVLELRWRSSCRTSSFTGGSFHNLGRRIVNGGGSKSKLLGRAEIPWKNVFESENMEIQTWVQMISNNHHDQDVKPPKLQVRMKVVGGAVGPKKKIPEKKKRSQRKWKEESCGCKDGGGCHCVDYIDYDIFALGFA